MKNRILLFALSFLAFQLNAQCPLGNVLLTTQSEVALFPAGCTVINGNLIIRDVNASIGLPDISSLLALANITTVTGNLEIRGTQIHDMAGLHSLTSVGGDFIIVNNSNIEGVVGLQTLDGLSSLTSIGGKLQISGNRTLHSISALTQVVFGTVPATPRLEITSNASLSNCCAQAICTFLSVPANANNAGIANNYPNLLGGECNDVPPILASCSVGTCTITNAQTQTNLLLNSGFDAPALGNGENYTGSFTFNGWTMTGGPFNVVRPNGSYGPGPNNARDGAQFVEVYYSSGTVYQDFTIDLPNTAIEFGGYFSGRVGSTFPASVQIFSMPSNASNGTLVSTSTPISISDTKSWHESKGMVTLQAGKYRYVANIYDDANFDAAYVNVKKCVWDGSVGNWSDNTKWSCGHSPTTADIAEINGGTVTMNVANIGSVRMSGGTLTGTIAVTLAGGLTMSGGTLTGNNTIEVTNELTWSGGTINGSGSMTVTGVTTITNVPTLDTRTLTLNGGGTITGGFNTSNSANLVIPLSKTLTWTNSADAAWGGNGGTLTLVGTLVKNGAGILEGTSQNFQNTGTLNLNDGSLKLGSSSTNSNARFNLAVNTSFLVKQGTHSFSNCTFTGTGTFGKMGSPTINTFTGNTIEPGMSAVGILGIQDYNVNLNSNTFNLELGGNYIGGYDQLQSNASIVLGGTLNISFVNGFTPAINDVFDIITCSGGCTGTFSNIVSPISNTTMWQVDVTTNPNQVRIKLVSIPPTVCTWNGTTGNWSDATKWSCGQVPTTNNNVVINSGTVTLDVSDRTIVDLTLSGGTLTGDKNIALAGTLTWSGGTISGSNIMNTMTVAMATTITNAPTLDTRKLTLNGGGTIAGGFNTSNGAELVIPSSKTLTVTNSTTILWGGNGGVLTLVGTLVKNGVGALECNFQDFHNTGTVNINEGTLRLGYGGTHNGATFNMATYLGVNRFLTIRGGTHTFNGCTFGGTGGFFVAENAIVSRFTNNTVQSMLSNFSIGGASTFNLGQSLIDLNLFTYFSTNPLTGTGTFNITANTMNITAGTLNFTGNLTANTMNISGGTISPTGDVIVNGNLNLSGGTIGGTGDLTVNGSTILSSAVTLARPFTNQSTRRIKGVGVINISGGGILTNNGIISPADSPNGVISQANSPGLLEINPSFTNPLAGTMEMELINSGTLTAPNISTDLFRSSGNIQLSGTLKILTSGALPNGTYPIIQSTGGTVSGTFTTVTYNGGNQPENVDVVYSSNQVQIIINTACTNAGDVTTIQSLPYVNKDLSCRATSLINMQSFMPFGPDWDGNEAVLKYKNTTGQAQVLHVFYSGSTYAALVGVVGCNNLGVGGRFENFTYNNGGSFGDLSTRFLLPANQIAFIIVDTRTQNNGSPTGISSPCPGTISVYAVPQASNNSYTTPLSISPAMTCQNTTANCRAAAYNEYFGSLPCTTGLESQLWYTFTATATSHNFRFSNFGTTSLNGGGVTYAGNLRMVVLDKSPVASGVQEVAGSCQSIYLSYPIPTIETRTFSNLIIGTTYYLVLGGYTNLNFDFCITPTSPLSVELLDLKAKNTEGGNLLTWQTANEVNNKGFQIERGFDGKTFENIGFIKAAPQPPKGHTIAYVKLTMTVKKPSQK
jgi:hypothetical protein